ncbi:hypothetical protein GGS23DRAFT_241972 [Durotheca rogersii]|uniref:uncharacterized protein n=1 Tax=Durotheca rogersii TaxID=419775 RepID=UPI0022207D0B|nr:uncharacterized protein GGS23DRAFT_241972 [Durotheca rogersii]KAI5860262.1 hypothetical protein GGS23DRAFT_241972 [Durotheca rogersii]
MQSVRLARRGAVPGLGKLQAEYFRRMIIYTHLSRGGEGGSREGGRIHLEHRYRGGIFYYGTLSLLVESCLACRNSDARPAPCCACARKSMCRVRTDVISCQNLTCHEMPRGERTAVCPNASGEEKKTKKNIESKRGQRLNLSDIMTPSSRFLPTPARLAQNLLARRDRTQVAKPRSVLVRPGPSLDQDRRMRPSSSTPVFTRPLSAV